MAKPPQRRYSQRQVFFSWLRRRRRRRGDTTFFLPSYPGEFQGVADLLAAGRGDVTPAVDFSNLSGEGVFLAVSFGYLCNDATVTSSAVWNDNAGNGCSFGISDNSLNIGAAKWLLPYDVSDQRSDVQINAALREDTKYDVSIKVNGSGYETKIVEPVCFNFVRFMGGTGFETEVSGGLFYFTSLRSDTEDDWTLMIDEGPGNSTLNPTGTIASTVVMQGVENTAWQWVDAPVNSVACTVNVDTDLYVGGNLSVVPGTWSVPGPYTYQWRANGSPISGATGTVFVLTETQAGQSIDVVETAANLIGSRSEPSSNQVNALALFAPTLLNGPLTISGTEIVGNSLSRDFAGIWDGNPLPIPATTRWERNDVDTGESGTTYLLEADDRGTVIHYEEEASNSQGTTEAESNKTGQIGMQPVNDVLPIITGIPTLGNVLSVSDGTWTAFPSPSFTYQWRRNSLDIPGAINNTYTSVLADVGQLVDCVVTADNGVVAPVNEIAPGVTIEQAPTLGTAPSIAGSNIVGGVLTRTASVWDGFPVPTITWVWRRDGAPIAGTANQPTYTTVNDDVGTSVDVQDTADNGVGPAQTANSNDIFVLPGVLEKLMEDGITQKFMEDGVTVKILE